MMTGNGFIARGARARLALTVSAAALLLAGAPAHAQTQEGSPPAAQQPGTGSGVTAPSGDQGTADPGNGNSDASGGDVVVTGVRASLSSAQGIKRYADQIVDSIVAEDIGKLPDRNVAEALQRITGIQIQRSYGEGSSIAIRGLSQVRTEINGRDVFTANNGRTLSLEDVPSELLAGVDVYKNPSANLIEGGIGGLVNLRTRKPFDFDGFKLSASATANYYDLYDGTKPQANLLVSDRWQTGVGEIGVLLDVAYQETAFRQDQISSQPFYLLNDQLNASGAPVNATDYATAQGLGRLGQPTYLSHGVGIGQYLGDRRRLGIDAAVQWRPTDTIDVTAEYVRSDYKFRYGDYSFFAYTGDNPITPDYTRPFTYDSEGNFRSGTFVNVPVNANTSLEQRHSVTNDYSLNAKWQPSDRLTINGDFQYIRGVTDGQRSIVILASTAERLTTSVGSGVPSMIISPDSDPANGNGLVSDPANYASGAGYLDHIEHSVGTEYAGRFDVEYKVDGGFLKSLAGGLRYTDRSAVTDSSTYQYYGLTRALSPDLYEQRLFRGDLYRGFQDVPTSAVFFDRDTVLDYGATRQTLAPFVDPSQQAALLAGVGYVPSDRNTQGEKTYTAYGVARFGSGGAVPIDGNIGVRLIKTKVSTAGFVGSSPRVQTGTDAITGAPIYGNGPITFNPVNVDSDYTKALPSLNLAFHFTDKLQLRLAASKALTRPGFDQLNPNITIFENNPTNGQRTATSGNADLRPLTADQLDASLEYYFSRTGSIYAAGFYKKVDGFIATITAPETYSFNGVDYVYQVTRPVNGDDGKIKGFEVGGNTFLDFLPGWLSGFGAQANFTYVDSKAPSPDAQDTSGAALNVPLEQLSKYSYNLIGFYDRGALSARVAYNWRSKYVVTTRGNGSGNLPIFNDARGQLDASVTLTVTPNFGLTVDGTNLTNTENRTYYGVASRPQSSVLNDRRVSITARLTY
ncbi:TonB-dependent receptor [Sphingomonas sp. BK580]|uniref:TonB-dependent receptor n=1 Tax=Sphingomonas sp. BK580 TaxID=2586972 RepID=UPI00160A3F28|nr:TonB-dependent receptor [Sphingomonas sp. BK580]MBB3693296.1 TonB-dependent receptor [Sphingomonas sp. BK580]